MSKQFKVKNGKEQFIKDLKSKTRVWVDDEQDATIFVKSEASAIAKKHKAKIVAVDVNEIEVESEEETANE